MEIACCALPLLWGLVYLPYFGCRVILTELARRNIVRQPAALFFCGLGIVLFELAFFAMLAFSTMAFSLDLWIFLLAALGTVGFILSLIPFADAKVDPTKKLRRQEALRKLAVTKFQIWIQDIFVATLVSGACLSIAFNVWPNELSTAFLLY